MKNYKLTKTLILLFCLLFVVSNGSSAFGAKKSPKKKWIKSKTGIKSLMTLSSDRGKMIKEMNRETKRYEKIKKAIENGNVSEGDNASDIKKRYGDPTIILQENDSDVARWVYKPGTESYFDGHKIYLFFDANGKLIRTQNILPPAK